MSVGDEIATTLIEAEKGEVKAQACDKACSRQLRFRSVRLLHGGRVGESHIATTGKRVSFG